jgi:basic amino acid/polyamine antiporter, APA family
VTDSDIVRPEARALVRALGPWAATAVVVGGTIGTAIFVAPSIIARDTGSPVLSLAVWAIGGALALSGALCFAELASAIPETGGIYAFLRRAYGTPLIAFLCAWTFFFVSGTGAIAAVATVFASYCAFFLPASLAQNPGVLRWIAIGCIACLTSVNYVGVKAGGQLQTAVTAFKVCAMAALVVVGLSYHGGDAHRLVAMGDRTRPVTTTLAGIGTALIPTLVAYGGWSYSATIAGEIHNPQRNVPRSIVAGLAVVLVVYLMVNVAYLYVLPFSVVQQSNHVASDMMHVVLGPTAGGVIAIGVMVSAIGALNALILSYARIAFAAARDGVFFPALARVHPRHRTPGNAVLVQGVVGSAFAFTGDYEHILSYFTFVEYLIFSLAVAAVVVLRRREPLLPRPYRVWLYPLPPIVFLGVSTLYLVSLLATRPTGTVTGIILMLCGVPFYLYWRRRSHREWSRSA